MAEYLNRGTKILKFASDLESTLFQMNALRTGIEWFHVMDWEVSDDAVHQMEEIRVLDLDGISSWKRDRFEEIEDDFAVENE